jgi:hypothetical protein
MGSFVIGSCCAGYVRPVITTDYALRRADDVSVWLGVFGGPSFFVATPLQQVGAVVGVGLDIAMVLSRALSFDVILRGAFDDYGFIAPFGQIAFGIAF